MRQFMDVTDEGLDDLVDFCIADYALGVDLHAFPMQVAECFDEHFRPNATALIDDL